MTSQHDICQYYLGFNSIEDLTCFRQGSLHLVLIDDTLGVKYRVAHKPGYGTFSTIWLAHDERIQNYVTVYDSPNSGTQTWKMIYHVYDSGIRMNLKCGLPAYEKTREGYE